MYVRNLRTFHRVSRTGLRAGQPERIPSPGTLAELADVMRGCTRCALAAGRTQVVPGSGSAAAGLLLVGEAPGAREDAVGIPFVGRSGQLLDATLQAAGLRREEIFIANVVRCRPPGNRDPRPPEIRACAGWLAEQIRLVAPRVVVPLGRFALQHFVPGALVSRLQGTLHEVEYAGRTLRLFPVLHPAAVLRSPRLRPGYEEQFARLAALEVA
jgi:uracil-DNA glycosylase